MPFWQKCGLRHYCGRNQQARLGGIADDFASVRGLSRVNRDRPRLFLGNEFRQYVVADWIRNYLRKLIFAGPCDGAQDTVSDTVFV
jgi:hypothetical protein